MNELLTCFDSAVFYFARGANSGITGARAMKMMSYTNGIVYLVVCFYVQPRKMSSGNRGIAGSLVKGQVCNLYQ